ncbi:MAG: 50S ribosomal protein L31 [Candidatus Pacebacteria bacterium]|nr:50S ribosomal protein L31 [Candidatus Paceibacterota bacterium]
MKKNLHPTWNNNATITCACGESFTTGSMTESIQVDICSKCHPFFTGEERFVDTQGRVDKFLKKMEAAKAKQAAKAKKKAKVVEKEETDSKTYQQLLAEQQVNLKKEEKQEAKAETTEVTA